MIRMSASPEEKFLISSVQPQIDTKNLHKIKSETSAKLNWKRIVQIAVKNKVGPVLYSNLCKLDDTSFIPKEEMGRLKNSYLLSFRRGVFFRLAIKELLSNFNQYGVKAIILRGLSLGELVYSDIALRPFTDVDILVRKNDLRRIKAIIKESDYVPYSDFLPERYYEKHHLHTLYIKKRGDILVEIHWSLDHKYTLFNIDYSRIFNEADVGKIAGTDSLIMRPEDALISLCVHLAKHCYFIKYTYNRPDFLPIILRHGFLILFYDIAKIINLYEPEIDWGKVIEKSKKWNVEEVVGPSLFSIYKLFGVPKQEKIFDKLTPPKIGFVEKKIVGKLITGSYENGKGILAEIGRRLDRINPDVIFRPIRGIDLIRYVFPGRKYIKQKYVLNKNWEIFPFWLFHFFKALGQISTNGADLIYFLMAKSKRKKFRLLMLL